MWVVHATMKAITVKAPVISRHCVLHKAIGAGPSSVTEETVVTAVFRVDKHTQKNSRDTVDARKGAHDGRRSRLADWTLKDGQVVVVQISVAYNTLEMKPIHARRVAVH